jgi:hypothetical protein
MLVPIDDLDLKTILRRIKHLLGVDRAVAFTVLGRSWTIFSGAFTIFLIARFLSLPEQGYYYTFGSLVSIQTVFELGFSFVVLQLAAHESAQLSIKPTGEVSGDEVSHARLASILQKSVRWYSVAAVLMGVTLIVAGFSFFSAPGRSVAVAWKLPWVCVVLPAIFTFQMDPVFSFLEGCGFVAQVARMRLTQAILGTALAWTVFVLHSGLFAPAAILAGQALAGFAFLASKRSLLLPLLRYKPGANIVSWRTEIWPFQWKMAVSFFCSYFIFPLFNPVLFAYRGAVEAGRMGMSLSIASALGTVAYAWINTKASPFGNMIARRDFLTLDRVFFRVLTQSGAVLLGLEVVCVGAIYALQKPYPHLAARMLPPPVFAVLLFAIFLNHLLYSEALYLRAHKREPFLILSILVAGLTGTSTLLTSKYWGAQGLTLGYFFTGGAFYLAGGTFIFARYRRLWHTSPESLTGS